MDLDTFEQRAAYIERCELEMRECQAKVAESKRLQEQFDQTMQLWHLQYEIWVWTELAPLIYRGMFDPTFCRPSNPNCDGGK